MDRVLQYRGLLVKRQESVTGRRITESRLPLVFYNTGIEASIIATTLPRTNYLNSRPRRLLPLKAASGRKA